MWRRVSAHDAVVAWRAPRDDVRDVLVREHVPASLGPHRDGWTVVRVLVRDDEVIEPRGREIVDLVDDLARSLHAPGAACLLGDWGARLLVVCSATAPPVQAELPPLRSTEPAERRAWADLLQAIGGLDRLEAVLSAAGPDGNHDRRHRVATAMRDVRPHRVAAAAGLPAQLFDPELVGDPVPNREVVACRDLDPGDPQLAASAVRMPLQVTDLGGTALIAAQPADGTIMFPVAAALGAGRRPALVLWRQGDMRGYQLIRKGEVEDTHIWGDDWEAVALDPDLDEELAAELRSVLTPGHGDAALLVDRIIPPGSARPDVVQLRSLLRRPSGPHVLSAFCELLDLSPSIATVAEGEADPSDLPGTVTVTPTSPARALARAVWQPRPNDPWFMRAVHDRPWWWRTLNIVWMIIATAWAIRLWPGGGLARAGAAILVLTAVFSVIDAVLPGRKARRKAGRGDATAGPPEAV